MGDSTYTQYEIERLLLSVDREGIPDLLIHIRENGFYDAPSSTSYHMSCEGGLAKHSLNVYNAAKKLCDTFGVSVDKDTLILTALLHDLGKMGQYGKLYYAPNILKSGKQSESKPYEINKDLMPVDHEIRSIEIASRFIELTEEEAWVIQMHNGMYGTFKYQIQGHETPLYLIIHFADMWASRVMEVGDKDEVQTA